MRNRQYECECEGSASRTRAAPLGAIIVLSILVGSDLAAQGRRLVVDLAGQAVGAGIRVDPAPRGAATSQFAVETPLLMARLGLAGTGLVVHGSLDLEGWTIPNGVLDLGAWGEGFVDRRHPHTYVHELMLSGSHRLSAGRIPIDASIGLGKGFVPFGSADPMDRPPLAFPVNHHWSQILERAVAIVGLAVGPVTIETARFNGDEPEHPGQWPSLGRFGDSWAHWIEVTLDPRLRLEASIANVKSPENRPGTGTDQRKVHASAVVSLPLGSGRLSGLAEWARTTEADGFFEFSSALGEAEWRRGAHRVYYRFERTDRPEEERTEDPFRAIRPLFENSIVGVTRWSIHTAGYGFTTRPVGARLSVEPIVEVSRGAVTDVGAGFFRAVDWYGGDRLWALTIAIRVSAGRHHPMGRYGVADRAAAAPHHGEDLPR